MVLHNRNDLLQKSLASSLRPPLQGGPEFGS